MKDTDTDHKLAIGDVVEYRGVLHVISERCGKNIGGFVEYYITTVNNSSLGTYAEEWELMGMKPEDSSPPPIPENQPKICAHNKAYLNKITTGLQFWVCPDCGEEVSEVIIRSRK